ncbi:hypothetical protein CMUS01_00278 [Colletotrichum musicola]|uniref:Uncharacterized protein n=1 Tax=Colletotrichum musicola TaxID=2175873 RepID=A0A8H6NZG0_9PEZI|nr:hypothetical protein CMUS01_00278 [Colletotrichum musicola]
MKPTTYLAMLLLASVPTSAAPSFHNHLERHRNRVATHAHISHEHSLLAKRAEAVAIKAMEEAAPLVRELPADKPPHQSPEEGKFQPTIRTTAPGMPQGGLDGRVQLAMAHEGGSLGAAAATGLDSHHLDAAMRLLHAHGSGHLDGHRRR